MAPLQILRSPGKVALCMQPTTNNLARAGRHRVWTLWVLRETQNNVLNRWHWLLHSQAFSLIVHIFTAANIEMDKFYLSPKIGKICQIEEKPWAASMAHHQYLTYPSERGERGPLDIITFRLRTFLKNLSETDKRKFVNSILILDFMVWLSIRQISVRNKCSLRFRMRQKNRHYKLCGLPLWKNSALVAPEQLIQYTPPSAQKGKLLGKHWNMKRWNHHKDGTAKKATAKVDSFQN